MAYRVVLQMQMEAQRLRLVLKSHTLWKLLFYLACLLINISEAKKKQSKLGQTVRLSCADFADNATKIVWYKAKLKVIPSERIILRKNNQILKIRNIKEKDLGLYTCNNVTDKKGPGKELVAYNVAYAGKLSLNLFCFVEKNAVYSSISFINVISISVSHDMFESF